MWYATCSGVQMNLVAGSAAIARGCRVAPLARTASAKRQALFLKFNLQRDMADNTNYNW